MTPSPTSPVPPDLPPDLLDRFRKYLAHQTPGPTIQPEEATHLLETAAETVRQAETWLHTQVEIARRAGLPNSEIARLLGIGARTAWTRFPRITLNP